MNDLNDRDLKQRLQDGAHKAPENPWFTRRLLNRLPDRQAKSGKWLVYTVCSIVLAGCIAGWTAIGNGAMSDKTAITLLDGFSLPQGIIFYTGLLCVTALTIQQIVATAMSSRR